MLTLYGCKGGGSAVVEAMLQYANIEYLFVEAIQWEPFKHHDDLIRLNPLKQIPTLVLEDGSVMTESAAIILWLCERAPSLMPTDPATRAQFYRWMIYVAANMYSIFPFRDFPAKWVDGEETQKDFAARCIEKMKSHWLQLETSLKPNPYALGNQITALDIYLAMLSRWSPGRTWFAANIPELLQAITLTEQHPVVAKVWESNFD